MTEVSKILYDAADDCGLSIRQIDETDQILPQISEWMYWHPGNRHGIVRRVLLEIVNANTRRYI